MESKDIDSDRTPNSDENEFARVSARTNLSHYWLQHRERWPQLLNSYAGLACVDGAIALAPQQNNITVSLVHRVFSSGELKYATSRFSTNVHVPVFDCD
jgi:hypothetical protein